MEIFKHVTRYNINNTEQEYNKIYLIEKSKIFFNSFEIPASREIN